MLRHYYVTLARVVAKSPLHWAVGVLGLALGFCCVLMAINVRIYLFGTDFSFRNSDRIYTLYSSVQPVGVDTPTPMSSTTSSLLAPFLRNDFPNIDVAFSTLPQELSVAVDGASSFRRAMFAEHQFLSIFDLPFIYGGGANALERPNSAIITEQAAIGLFGTAQAVGRTMLVDGAVVVEITGVISEIPDPSHFNIPGSLHGKIISNDGTSVRTPHRKPKRQ